MGSLLVASAVLIGFIDGEAEYAVRRAIAAAEQHLTDSRCRQVLSDFRLSDAPDAVEAFRSLRFIDGRGTRYCNFHFALAFTSVGARVVSVCPTQFKGLFERDPVYAAMTLIHEFLHSRGLGEDPPPSAAITARVVARCK